MPVTFDEVTAEVEPEPSLRDATEESSSKAETSVGEAVRKVMRLQQQRQARLRAD